MVKDKKYVKPEYDENDDLFDGGLMTLGDMLFLQEKKKNPNLTYAEWCKETS